MQQQPPEFTSMILSAIPINTQLISAHSGQVNHFLHQQLVLDLVEDLPATEHVLFVAAQHYFSRLVLDLSELLDEEVQNSGQCILIGDPFVVITVLAIEAERGGDVDHLVVFYPHN